MYCNISWPTKIEFVVLSLNKEVDVPRILLNNLFSAIVDKLEAAKSKIFGNIEFAKTASKIIIKPLTVVKTVKSISDDLCREINTNALFVVIVYPKENERDAIMLARDLTRNFRFAIALFNKTFADVLSNPKNPSNDVVLQELERVTENLLRDVSKVIAKRAALVDVQPSSSAQNSEGVERDIESPKSIRTIVEERKLNDVTRFSSNPSDDIACPNEQMNAHQNNLLPRTSAPAVLLPAASSIHRSRSASLLNCPSYDTMQNLNQLKMEQFSSCLKKISKGYIPKLQTAPSSVNGSLNTPAFVPQIPTQQQNRVAVSLFNGSINNFRNCSDMSRFKLTTFSVFKPVDFKVGQYYDIVVTHVTEKGDFYFQPHQHRKYIDFLTFRMQLYYLSLNDDETRLSYDTILSCEDLTDVWCAAPFSCNLSSPDAEHYYRARIVARVTPTNYDVSFVDYGNRCVVPFSNLKFLPDSFSRLGSFAHCCRLSKSTWVDVCALKEKLATKPFALVRLENLDADPWEGRLFLTDGRTEEDIGVYLASIGAATFAVGAANFAVNDKH